MMPKDIAPLLLFPQPGYYKNPAFYAQVRRELEEQDADPEDFEVLSIGAGHAEAALRGWLFRGEPGAPLVILSHGVMAGRVDMANLCAELSRRGINAACYDSRAHGLSKGRCITYGHHEAHDLVAIADQLMPEVGATGLILGGLSMGGSISLLASGDPRVQGVATFSAYFDFTACFDRYLRLCIPGLGAAEADAALTEVCSVGGFSRETVSPAVALARHTHFAPLLIQHGGLDELIPAAQAEALQKAWRGPVRLEVHQQAGHADILGDARALQNFFAFVEERANA